MAIGRKWSWAGAAVVLGAASIAGVVASTRDDVVSPAGAQSASPPAPVVTFVIEGDQLAAERRYQGEVRAVAHAALTVGEAGRVQSVLVAEGDRVAPGQRLLDLDDRLAQAQLGEAAATRKSIQVQQKYASRRTDRFEKLEKEQVVSRGEIERERVEADRLKAQARAARASIAALSQRVQRHRIDAPFAGVVSRVHVDPGDWLMLGQAAIELVTSERVEVHVRVPVSILDRVGEIVTTELVRGRERVPARLQGVVDALDPATRTGLLRLEPDARPSWLHPGSAITVSFTLEEGGGVVVPRDALVRGIAETRVVRVVDGKAEPVKVEVLARAGTQALVRGEGLKKGQRIVIRGNERLRPGQAVTTEGAMTNPAATAKPEP